MKHSPFIKTISTFMALAVVLASFSFKIEQHFCGSNLVDVSVLSKVESCCSKGVEKNNYQKISEQSCCSNISIVVEGFENYQTVVVTEFKTLPDFAVTPSLQIPIDYIFETLEDVSFSDYNPPPLIFDMQVRDQVFLI